MSDTQQPYDPQIDDPEDAASLACYKLNAILTLVEDGAKRADDLHPDEKDDDGGYGLMSAAEMIRDLRDYLRRCVDNAKAEREATRGGVR